MTDTVAGFIGGVISIYVGLPLDTIKVRLQTKGHIFKSATNCAHHSVTNEGITALFKGALPAVSIGVIENAVVFSVNGILHRTFCKKNETPSFLKMCALNGASAIFSSFSVTPSEVLKCRLQSNIGFGEQSHIWNIIKDIYHYDGIFGFWRGLLASWMRDIPFYMIFFGSYTHYKSTVLKKFYSRTNYTTDSLPAWHYIIGGGLSGCAGVFTIFPIDVVKSKQQTTFEKISVVKTVNNIYAEGGIRSFYRGVWPGMLRGFPAYGGLFLGVEYTKTFFNYLGLDAGASLGSKHRSLQ